MRLAAQRRLSPQRRTALVSVGAAVVLIALKLGTGIVTGSLGLVSEAIHSGTDLIAALLTFFAVGISGRPADRSHPYGHGKAEHLSALAEGAILVVASLLIAYEAIARLAGRTGTDVEAPWYALVVIAAVIAIDLARTAVSLRAGRRYRSEALLANALHFGGDLAGSIAVLAGLLLVRAGYQRADAAAALFVAALVLVAAGRLMARNTDVLMDRAPDAAQASARAAIEGLRPPVELRRLRIRSAGGRHFADVVIGISPTAALAEGHRAADAVEDAVRGALPESDVVVHVEPKDGQAPLPERALAAALAVEQVREIHDVNVLRLAGRTEVSLHLKLPGDLSLEQAHTVASAVEAAIQHAVPEVDAVRTHLEPLSATARGGQLRADEAAQLDAAIRDVVLDASGSPPRELRLVTTDAGPVAFLTLALRPESPLSAAHDRASELKGRILSDLPHLADVFIHTEP